MTRDELVPPVASRRHLLGTVAVFTTLAALFLGNGVGVHAGRRMASVVVPGRSGDPPSDALVLFDGTDLSAWDGAEKWMVKEGVAIVGNGDIRSKQSFGDCQLHVEWLVPEDVTGSGQDRGNSGLYLMERYEIQILDSYENKTYQVGQAGAIYGRKAPLVNACRKPGEWQAFDTIFTAPRFAPDGKPQTSGYITVLHNGVLIHNHVEIPATAGKASEDGALLKAPIKIQDHGNPVRFRNIWVREL